MNLNGSKVTVAALQCELQGSREENVSKIQQLVEAAATQGANIILPPELFEGPYFCKVEDESFFDLANPAEDHLTILQFQKLAKRLEVVIPVSFFEREGPHYYNSVAMINADGEVLGIYRKTHIPDGPGYEEKFYFRPGNTGFKVWSTKFGNIGVGICWDQWFPECARSMVLAGADLLLYPTAIGSEPHDPGLDTRDPWQRVMIGHAVANAISVVAANRIGNEDGQIFYGHSFICDHRGEKLAQFTDKENGVLVATLDFHASKTYRAAFGFFRDRQPQMYDSLVK